MRPVRIDILVNSAGVIQPGRVENANIEQWRRVMEINLMATLYTCTAAIGPTAGAKLRRHHQYLLDRRATGKRRFGPYSTNKFALTAMTEGMRQELGSHGIRVCITEPGVTHERSLWKASPIRNIARRFASTSIRRPPMKPEDVAFAIVLVVPSPPRANISSRSFARRSMCPFPDAIGKASRQTRLTSRP